ncbi:conserved hypothetical protein [Neospora caninum Liverpool]|uniref:Transmembrane protein n=1 Tax=Neospora caninum (strain Liverpool) TaxID=572307 RepID=F0V7Z1_NEOCL|nr:conserved hypothetical protein [Neospora caninum Liverpool]CBZ49832.1 conserved hypothetical protein [Neospora caninum Liverpool]CEL64421.1 TPA: hypothetical protein BN1204_003180 [Neospora caninum Liverpool]|eukprot:XP_003879867.1 conserved hypothetical protein [Neospora caninum Liverpool]
MNSQRGSCALRGCSNAAAATDFPCRSKGSPRSSLWVYFFLVGVAVSFAAVLVPEKCAASMAMSRLPSQGLEGTGLPSSMETLLDEEEMMSTEEELKSELRRIKQYRDMNTTTTTKPPPKNIVVDAGKEAGMGFWNGLLAPFRLARDLVTKPRETVNFANASTALTMSKLRDAAVATVKWENVGRHWREFFRDLVRAATMHPGRQRELERVARLEKANIPKEVLYASESAREEAERRIQLALRSNESKREEELREIQKQKERYEKYKKMKEQESANAAKTSVTESRGQGSEASGTKEQTSNVGGGGRHNGGQERQ